MVKRRHLIVHIPALTFNYLAVSFIMSFRKICILCVWMLCMCVDVVDVSVSVCHMHAMQRTLDLLELELYIVRSHPIGDRN